MTKEELSKALAEGNETTLTAMLKNSKAANSETYILIIMCLSDLSSKEDQSDYQNAITLLDNIDYERSLASIVKGWNLFSQYSRTQAENDTALSSHSSEIDSQALIEHELDAYSSDDETDHSTSLNDSVLATGELSFDDAFAFEY